MKEQLSKRAGRYYSRKMLVGGNLATCTVAEHGKGCFPLKYGGSHVCTWIPGDIIEVCTKCGRTRPKEAKP